MVSNTAPPPREGRYTLVQRCVSCKKILSRNQIFYSDGVCPLCGYDSDSTICSTERFPTLVGASGTQIPAPNMNPRPASLERQSRAEYVPVKVAGTKKIAWISRALKKLASSIKIVK